MKPTVKPYKHPTLKGLSGSAYRKEWLRLNPDKVANYVRNKKKCACQRPPLPKGVTVEENKKLWQKGLTGFCMCREIETSRIWQLIGIPTAVTELDTIAPPEPKPFLTCLTSRVARAYMEFRASLNITVPEIESHATRNGYYEAYQQRRMA